ncbi:MAG: hypothetical protein AB7T63_14115 [Planctomycetota bacterium]
MRNPLSQGLVFAVVIAVAALGATCPAAADEAWRGRISDMVERVEAVVHRLDAQHPVAGAELAARLEGLHRRISTLEHANGLPVGNLHVYKGTNETRELESLTQAAAHLGQRAGKVKVTVEAALTDKLRKSRERHGGPDDGGTTTLLGGSRTAVPARTPAHGPMGEGAKWVQAYDPTLNRTIWAVTRIPSARDLWQEVSIEFQHEEGTVNFPAEDPGTWPLSRLLREATLRDHVNNIFVDHDRERTFPDEGAVTLRVGPVNEGIELESTFRKDKTLAMLAGQNRAELMNTTWPASGYRQLMALAKELGPTALPYGQLLTVTYSIPSEARGMLFRLMDAFQARDDLGADVTVEDVANREVDPSGCRKPAGAVDRGQR